MAKNLWKYDDTELTVPVKRIKNNRRTGSLWVDNKFAFDYLADNDDKITDKRK